MVCGSVFPFTVTRSSSRIANFSLAFSASPRSDDDRNTVKFCLALQTCSNVDRIAKNRIVEAKVRSEIADNASTGVYAYADAKWQERLAGARGLLLTLPIERLEAVDHVQCGRARFELMVWNIQRCVPECHDRIADVFVDGSFVTR